MIRSTFILCTTLSTLGVLLLSASLPLIGLAERPTSDRPERQSNGLFCARINEMEKETTKRIQNKRAEISDQNAQEDRKATRLETLAKKRAQHDALRADRYVSLKDKAKTDAQTDAVDTFADVVELLVEERRKAVDVAIAEFESDVRTLHDERKKSIEDQAEDLEKEIENLITEAKQNCESMSDQKAKRIFMADKKELRSKTRGNLTKVNYRAEFKEMRNTRKEAIREATDRYRAGLKEAKDILRTAFSN